METRNRYTPLALALLATGLMASGTVLAQSAANADARVVTEANSHAAHQEARDAKAAAEAARLAAQEAAAEERAGALTADGAAQAL